MTPLKFSDKTDKQENTAWCESGRCYDMAKCILKVIWL